tara:strand:- start:1360 stop:1974 length:615 start_codon:yes stop_codon:yes gene_type:complete
MNTLAEDHTNTFIKENEISNREIEEEIILGQIMQMLSHQQTDLVNYLLYILKDGYDDIEWNKADLTNRGKFLPPFSPRDGVANTWENWNRTNLIEMWNWHLVDRFYEENLSVEFKDIFKVFNLPTYTFEKQKWVLIPNKIEMKEQVIKYQDNLKKEESKKKMETERKIKKDMDRKELLEREVKNLQEQIEDINSSLYPNINTVS